MGRIRFDLATHLSTQSNDGVPIQFYQIRDGERFLFYPDQYATGAFEQPTWMKWDRSGPPLAAPSFRHSTSHDTLSAMTEPLLEIRQAEKRSGGLTAVDGVSFAVTKGQIFGIAGPNGSGKSTLFNLITGIHYRPTSGEVHFEGRQINHWPAHRIARAGLARTFQKDAEFPDLSAAETVLIGAVYGGGFSGRQAPSEVVAALGRVGFDAARRDMQSADLSVFEKKQIMIASALVSRPKVL